jgi:WhiB family redox-sensing transcriptional regulator
MTQRTWKIDINFAEYREIELNEYMKRARPAFSGRALCRGSIYPEIEAARSKAILHDLPEPLDVSTTFFPSRGGSAKVVKAKKMCNNCPVQWECFEYAYEGHELAGVWGGSSVDDRDECHREDMDPEKAFISIHGKKQFILKFPDSC